ncbi:MAG: S9 family peptidase, partial [Mycobacteriales bacterium]
MSTTEFHDLCAFIALPRVTRMVMRPDGGLLIVEVQHLRGEGDRYTTTLWALDPAGDQPTRRVTWSANGETAAAFSADGTLLFTTKRADAGAGDDGEKPSLWALPSYGEAYRVAGAPAGIGGVVTAAGSAAYVCTTDRFPGTDEETDSAWRATRSGHQVNAVIHGRFPIRHGDHELGPNFPR